MTDAILVLNAGSSSLKFSVFPDRSGAAPVRVSAAALDALERLVPLAPLHQPHKPSGSDRSQLWRSARSPRSAQPYVRRRNFRAVRGVAGNSDRREAPGVPFARNKAVRLLTRP